MKLFNGIWISENKRDRYLVNISDIQLERLQYYKARIHGNHLIRYSQLHDLLEVIRLNKCLPIDESQSCLDAPYDTISEDDFATKYLNLLSGDDYRAMYNEQLYIYNDVRQEVGYFLESIDLTDYETCGSKLFTDQFHINYIPLDILNLLKKIQKIRSMSTKELVKEIGITPYQFYKLSSKQNKKFDQKVISDYIGYLQCSFYMIRNVVIADKSYYFYPFYHELSLLNARRRKIFLRGFL